MLRYYGVPSTIIHLIQQLYDNAASGAIDNYTSHPTVIRQCCMPSNTPIDNYTSHPTVIRQCCMPSNPGSHRQLYISSSSYTTMLHAK
ncbi:unnamed protein product [Trichobilharzia regenti]|nr:unnamed protein product [Trichobilharzia regenti]